MRLAAACDARPHGRSAGDSAQSQAGGPTTIEALDPWSPLVSYVGNRGDVIRTGRHHGEAPWHRKLEGPTKPGHCAKTAHCDVSGWAPSTSQRDGCFFVAANATALAGALEGRSTRIPS